MIAIANHLRAHMTPAEAGAWCHVYDGSLANNADLIDDRPAVKITSKMSDIEIGTLLIAEIDKRDKAYAANRA